MKCQGCGKTISQKDRFCRHCGTTVTSDAIQSSRLHEDEQYHALQRNQIVARCEPTSGTWGAHIYASHSGNSHPRSRPRGCPEWVEARDWGRWFQEGLVVWDNATRRIGALYSAEAVRLHEDLQGSDEWRLAGLAVVERGNSVRPVPDHRKSGGRRATVPFSEG